MRFSKQGIFMFMVIAILNLNITQAIKQSCPIDQITTDNSEINKVEDADIIDTTLKTLADMDIVYSY